jgi:hypothetical protein
MHLDRLSDETVVDFALALAVMNSVVQSKPKEATDA